MTKAIGPRHPSFESNLSSPINSAAQPANYEKHLKRLLFQDARQRNEEPLLPKFTFSSSSPSSSDSPSRFAASPWRSYSDMATDTSLELAEPLIMKWNIDTSSETLFTGNRREAVEFVKCVNNLRKGMHLMDMELETEGKRSDKMIRAENLMQIAMKRLQKEFYLILSMNRAHLHPESISARSSRRTSAASRLSMSDYEEEEEEEDDSVSIGDESTTATADLRMIAECMIASGYAKECLKIYGAIRKSIVDEGIYKLGVEKFTSSQIQKMDWDTLDLWTNAVTPAVKTLFNGERILCDQIFAMEDQIRESCFAEVTKDGAMILFGFPEKVAKNMKKKAEKTLCALDMYAAIANNWPEIDSIFSSKSTNPIKSQAINSLIKLAEFIRAAVDDFESFILKDSSRKVPAGAGIHQLTTDAMDYLTYLADYTNILPDIFTESEPKKSVPVSFEHTESPSTPISVKISWLILSVLCKLDAKASHYKDASLSYLFLANNLQYIIGKVRTSNLVYLLSKEWISSHEAKVKQYAANYQRQGWSHVMESIDAAEITPEKVREKFQKFNSSFKQAYDKHCACVVPDNKLRDQIKIALAKEIVRPYREFYNANVVKVMENQRYPASIVRYAPEDVGHHLSDLFFGDKGSRWSSAESSPAKF